MGVPLLTVYQQGLGAAGADDLNSLVRWTPLAVDLRDFTPLGNMQVSVSGSAAIDDGGAGVFYYAPTSTATDNGTSVIQPTGQTQGRWILLTGASLVIPAGSITNAQLANVPTGTIKSRLVPGTGSDADNTLPAVLAAFTPATTTTQGPVVLATNAQAIAGTNTTNAVTPAGLAAAVSSASPPNVTAALTAMYWQSGQITITAGAGGFLTHTLGVIPKRVVANLLCTSAINQYLVGDVIPLGGDVEVWIQNNTTTLGYQILNGTIPILDASGNNFNATSSNFTILVRAWAI